MTVRLLLSFLTACSLNLAAQTSTLLAIKPRLQWPNANGYCGETSIQMCGLYYGNYISQDLCRTVAGGEVLINVNDTAALSAFAFTFQEWDPSAPTPQYQNYLDWVKQYLSKKHPVIITVYIKGLSDPDYDHIIPAIGFNAGSVNTYSGTDQLTYNSCFDTTSFTRTFASIYDTRSMNGNGAAYSYCIPQNVNYGVAVTGIKDPGRLTRPVHIVLDSLDEPNVSLSAAPRMMKAWITADSLTPGKSYALLRYNNYQTVPSSGFSPSNASSALYFTASGMNVTEKDSFMSNTGVFYRCIPYTSTLVEENSGNNLEFGVFPNPSGGHITISLPMDAENIFVTNTLGQCLLEKTVRGMSSDEIELSSPGLYLVKVTAGGTSETRKVVVR
jgi:hypothetical protein